MAHEARLVRPPLGGAGGEGLAQAPRLHVPLGGLVHNPTQSSLALGGTRSHLAVTAFGAVRTDRTAARDQNGPV